MSSESELIAAIASLPIAPKEVAGRNYSKDFWEAVFLQLKSFPISILAGNLFIQHLTDSASTIEDRLNYFLDIYKKIRIKKPTVAVLGQWEHAHSHTKLIKTGLRAAGIRVLTGSPQHHLHSVRVQASASSLSQFIGVVGISGRYAGLTGSELGDENTATAIPPQNPAEVLETYLRQLQRNESLRRLVVVLPIPITEEIARVADSYSNAVIALLSGAVPPKSDGSTADYPARVPQYQVAIPTYEELIARGCDEIRPEYLFTRISLPNRRS